MKKIIEVTQAVSVEAPDSLFTDSFMEEFRKYFYDFTTPQEHLEHLAQLHARGLANEYSFIEGYGKASELGIKFEVLDTVMA